MKIKILTAFFLLFSAISAYAVNMLSANKVISGLPPALEDAKKQTDAPVLFPTEVPTTDKKYFASTDPAAVKNGFVYWINVDATASCAGVHVCNIGSMRAEMGKSPTIEYDMQNQEITIPVILKSNIKAYFTPGHSMGDYFPPQIQWRAKNVLYTLVWSNITKPSEHETLLQMANSAIAQK